MVTTPRPRLARTSSAGTLTTSGLVWGFLLGLPAGLVLQIALSAVLGPLGERWGWVEQIAFFSPLPALAIAAVVVLVPRLREWGAGFAVGLALGMATEGLLLWWWLSTTF